MLSAADPCLNQYEDVRRWFGGGVPARAGNGWVLSPKHSLNRRPLLCADPHLTAQLPAVVHEVHLAAHDAEVSGMTYPGMPGVGVIGQQHAGGVGCRQQRWPTRGMLFVERRTEPPLPLAQTGRLPRCSRRRSPYAGPSHTSSASSTRHGPLYQ